MVSMCSRVIITNKSTGKEIWFQSQINSVEIERSYNNITQTAKVVIPRYRQFSDPTQPDFKISIGDSISIELGYDGKYNKEFEGYITAIKPTTPIELMCEDEMWQQKQKTVNKAWKNVTMKEVITYLVPGTDTKFVPDITFNPFFRLEKVSVAKALEKLKEYGVVIYYRDKKLFVGFPYYDTNVNQTNYLFDSPQNDNRKPTQNKRDPNVKASSSLEFRRADDYKVKVQAICILRDNKKLQVEVGDSEGETRTRHFANIATESELRQIATEELKKIKSSGLTGTFKAFGFPFVDHGWTLSLYSYRHPEWNGYYFAEKVKVSYNSNGYEHEITPGRKASTIDA